MEINVTEVFHVIYVHLISFNVPTSTVWLASAWLGYVLFTLVSLLQFGSTWLKYWVGWPPPVFSITELGKVQKMMPMTVWYQRTNHQTSFSTMSVSDRWVVSLMRPTTTAMKFVSGTSLVGSQRSLPSAQWPRDWTGTASSQQLNFIECNRWTTMSAVLTWAFFYMLK